MTIRLPAFVCLILGVALTAAGQKMITLNPVTVAGELVQAGPRSVIVKGGDGKNWNVTLGGGTKVKIKGTAVPETLTPRVSVRFVASIDKKTGKAQDKLDKITIFTPTQGDPSRTLGVELAKAGAGGGKDDEAGMGGPMVIPNMRPNPAPGPGQGQAQPADPGPTPDVIPGTGDEPPAGAKPKRGGGRAAKSPAASVPAVASYEVCAQVVSYHNRKLTVTAPNRYFKQKITAELSPEAEIALDLSDLSFAKPGDKVSAKGYYIQPGVCQHTDSVVITLSNPLGEKAGRSHRPKPAAKSTETPRRPAGKAKPEPAEQNPAGDAKPAPDEKSVPDPFADKPVQNKDRPKDDDNPVMDDPNAKPAPAPQPKPDETKPDAKKSDDSAEKKPPQKNEEKDIFEK
jgi:hypothetical protein